VATWSASPDPAAHTSSAVAAATRPAGRTGQQPRIPGSERGPRDHRACWMRVRPSPAIRSRSAPPATSARTVSW